MPRLAETRKQHQAFYQHLDNIPRRRRMRPIFYKRFIGYHVIDRALRFSGGTEICDKEIESIMTAYVGSWVSRYGAFKTLYSDGELGLNNLQAINELKRYGTDLKVRAPGQLARLVETRQAMLRHVMHLTEEDLKRHNHSIPFKRLYGEALFVVNAFSFYHGCPMYNALFRTATTMPSRPRKH